MRVSIGIPFYNSRTTLIDSIRSVFAQSYRDWELLLIDDGSTDGSLDIARSVNDRRVRVLSDGHNRGLVYRLNEFVNKAQGEYLARMDDDDIMHPDRLRQQISYLDTNPDTDLVGTSVYTLTLNNQVSGAKLLTDDKLTPCNVIARCILIHPTITGRAEWFRRNQYDSKFLRAEDHELWSRTITFSTIGVIEEPLLFYREGRSRTMKKYLMSGRSSRRVFAKYGPSSLGTFSTAVLIAKSLIKDCVYCSLWMCRLEDLAIRQSRNQLDAYRREQAELRLAEVRVIAVPGIDPGNTSRASDATRPLTAS